MDNVPPTTMEPWPQRRSGCISLLALLAGAVGVPVALKGVGMWPSWLPVGAICIGGAAFVVFAFYFAGFMGATWDEFRRANAFRRDLLTWKAELEREREALAQEQEEFRESARKWLLNALSREEKWALQDKYGGYGEPIPELQEPSDEEEGA